MPERSIRDMTISTLLAEAQELQPDVVRLRRTIHRQPELGLQLPRTQAAILQALDGLGLRLRKGGRLTPRRGRYPAGRCLRLARGRPLPGRHGRDAARP